MNDAANNGWNGSELTISINNVVVASETVTALQNQFNFEACEGDNLEVSYFSSGTNTEQENSFVILLDGSLIYASGPAPNQGLIYSTPISCSAPENQFLANGSTFQSSCNCYTLTTTGQNQAGTAWNVNQLNLSEPFDFTFEVFLGCQDGGADGITFSLIPASSFTSSTGSGLGIAGISPSLSVAIDTYQNGQEFDPFPDHISLHSNGDLSHISLNNLSGPFNLPNMEDCQFHNLQVTWNPAVNQYQVFLDGTLYINQTIDISNSIFSGETMVTWGFSGSTGDLSNLQQFCTLIPETINEVEICEGESYFEQSSEYTVAGTYTDIYTSTNGCDSAVITNLTINPVLETTHVVEICEGDSYFEQTSEYTETGTYTDFYSSENGCDSVVLTILSVIPFLETINEIELCQGDSYFEQTSEYTAAGTYIDTYSSENGCDSIVYTILTVNPNLEITNEVEICEGDSYFEQTSEYTVQGTYTDVYPSVNGCDSTVITILKVNQFLETNNEVQNCDGDSYFEQSSEYTVQGTYTDIYSSINGCDSIVNTILEVEPAFQTTNDVEICDGETYLEQTSAYTISGTYTDIYSSISGCDSIVITNLTVHPILEVLKEIQICEGDSYFEQNSEYTTSGTYTDTYSSINGCDSTIITYLTVYPALLTNVDIEICEGESYFEQNSEYSISGTYTDVYTAITGCDSTVITNLVLKSIIETTIEENICEGEVYVEGDSEYDSTGVYTDLYTSAYGCDSIVYTVLTVNEPQSIFKTVDICEGEIYSEGNSIYSETNTYTDIYQSISGCDSTVTTQLTVHPNKETSIFEIVCEGEPLPELGSEYDEVNNRFIDSLQTSIGCDSVVYTFLEYFNTEVLLPAEVSLCDGESFVANIEGIDEEWTVNWSTGNTTSSETFSEEGNYWVEINSDYCIASDTISINIHDPFTFETSDLILCSDSDLILDLSDEDGSISWSDGTIGNSLAIDGPGSYTAQITNACGSYTYSANVTEIDCGCKLYIPNAFTADGYNLNETFTVMHDCDFLEYEFLIFNRWGEIVFRTEDPNESWIGNHQNGEYFVPQGVYSYLVKYTSRDLNDRAISNKMQGSVSIIR